MELVRFRAHQAVTAFTFRGQAPLFDLAPFRLIATPAGQRVQLEAQAPDGKTTMTASADLAAAVAPSTSL
jgi:3-methylfumaryl-CoA hydratase